MSTGTPQSRREELERKHAEDLARLEQEEIILQHLPDEVLSHEHMVHLYRLYDSAGSIHFNYSRYESIRKGSQPTLDLVRRLAELFPEVINTSIYRDGCVGIRTASDATAEYAKAAARMADGADPNATITPIAPYWAKVEPAPYSQEVSLEWFVRIAGLLLRLHVEFPYWGDVSRKLGTGNVRYEYHHDRSIARYIGKTWTPAPETAVINDAKQRDINYGGGGQQDCGHWLLYWDSCNGDHANSTILDLVERLR